MFDFSRIAQINTDDYLNRSRNGAVFFVIAAKELRSEDYFLTDDTDKHRLKKCLCHEGTNGCTRMLFLDMWSALRLTLGRIEQFKLL